MRGNSFGRVFVVTTFGESHGSGLGAVIDGCPAGVKWRQDLLEGFLARRRPGASKLTSARNEADEAKILSGVFEGLTLGTPIAAVIYNQDARSQDYVAAELEMRRGHATDLWAEKYGHSDPRGSGRASGRETVSRVIAGSVARMLVQQLHPEVSITAFTTQIGGISLDAKEIDAAFTALESDPWQIDKMSLRCPSTEKNSAMEKLLVSAQHENESFGGAARLQIHGLPIGLGEPVFGKLKNYLASAMLSVGATSAFEIGDGIAAASQSGKAFHAETQDYGGLRGGLSTGEALRLWVALKPTSSRNEVAKRGRHDPCIVPRAVPVLECMAWIVLADLILLSRLDKI